MLAGINNSFHYRFSAQFLVNVRQKIKLFGLAPMGAQPCPPINGVLQMITIVTPWQAALKNTQNCGFWLLTLGFPIFARFFYARATGIFERCPGSAGAILGTTNSEFFSIEPYT